MYLYYNILVNINVEAVNPETGELLGEFANPDYGVTKADFLAEISGLRGSTILVFNSSDEITEAQDQPVEEETIELLDGAIQYKPASATLIMCQTIEPVTLSEVPNNILEKLVRPPDTIVSREELLECLSSSSKPNYVSNLKVIDNYVKAVRDALGIHKNKIRTVKGVGFIFDNIR